MATVASHHHGIIDNLVAFAQNTLSRYADHRRKHRLYVQTLNELHGLTMRDMADLGISPSNIKSIAYEAAYGK